MPNRKKKHHHKAMPVVRDVHQVENAVEKLKQDACPECGSSFELRGAVKDNFGVESICRNPFHLQK